MTTSRDLFDTVLPAMLADLGPACARVNAVVQLWVTRSDVDVAGVLVLDAAPRVLLGDDPDADLFLALDESILSALLTGTLDVERALADGTMSAAGDLTVLARLASLLEGAKGPLATRLGSAP
ncbi:MAG: SCP2 sterol-binding domain-containing protein [Deltaproteobacteria bacterium]|nr:SCP2 sterol-binding domain-containing protein [Deltaproteobacteria bacterium]